MKKITTEQYINKLTIEFVFSQKQYEDEFIEAAKQLGLSNYFINVDFEQDNFDFEDYLSKVRMVTKLMGNELDYMLVLHWNNLVRLHKFMEINLFN